MTAINLRPLAAIEQLTLEELDFVGAGSESVTNIIAGVGGLGAGVATVGGGLEVAGLAGALIVGGGVVVGGAGIALAGYGIYSYFHDK